MVRLAPDTIALPLGLGHRDHQRTHEAGLLLLDAAPQLARNWLVFADVPYRARFGEQAAGRLAELRRRGCDLRKLDVPADRRKAAALAEYPTQTQGLGDLRDAERPEDCYLLVWCGTRRSWPNLISEPDQ